MIIDSGSLYSLGGESNKSIQIATQPPWMATPKSKLLQTLDYYWNQYWSQNNKVKLIVCGSSASWIINNIINNHGGLHNRITESIKLKPFDLHNTKKYLDHQGINLNKKQIMLLYLATGGVPFYLSKIKWNSSAVQIIEKLAFRENAFFLQEFNNLFSSLFDDDEIYIKIVRALAKSRDGIGKTELLELVGSVGSNSAKRLQDLEDAGFIISFKPAYHKRQGIYYRLIDEYTSFYIRWLEPLKQTLQEHSLDKGAWQEMRNSPEWYSWLGYAFESLCYKHLIHIRRALELQPSAVANAWRHVPRKDTVTRGAQIDLLFDRRDDAVTICEIKYSDKPYVITKDYAEKIKQKLTVFEEQTKTSKDLFVAFISAAGLKQNGYAKTLVGSTVSLDDLFKEIN